MIRRRQFLSRGRGRSAGLLATLGAVRRHGGRAAARDDHGEAAAQLASACFRPAARSRKSYLQGRRIHACRVRQASASATNVYKSLGLRRRAALRLDLGADPAQSQMDAGDPLVIAGGSSMSGAMSSSAATGVRTVRDLKGKTGGARARAARKPAQQKSIIASMAACGRADPAKGHHLGGAMARRKPIGSLAAGQN